MALQTYDLNYFLGKNLFGNDVSQNMSDYQLTLYTLELRKDKGTDYVCSVKSKGAYTFKL